MRIYLGGLMFVQAEVEYNLRLAAKLRELGFEVYCPNETEPINEDARRHYPARRLRLRHSGAGSVQRHDLSG